MLSKSARRRPGWCRTIRELRKCCAVDAAERARPLANETTTETARPPLLQRLWRCEAGAHPPTQVRPMRTCGNKPGRWGRFARGMQGNGNLAEVTARMAAAYRAQQEREDHQRREAAEQAARHRAVAAGSSRTPTKTLLMSSRPPPVPIGACKAFTGLAHGGLGRLDHRACQRWSHRVGTTYLRGCPDSACH